MALLIQYTLLYASVLMLVALGGMMSERSGVINLGLEGIMVMGALGGALTMSYMPASVTGFSVFLLALLASVVCGMIYSLFLAVAAINFRADQTIVGTAMNMLATALATVIVKAINTSHDKSNVSSIVRYIDQKKNLIINIGNFEFGYFIIVAVLVLICAYIMLYRTKIGLHLMSCGEHPQAADSVMIFGQWKPFKIAAAALLFGLFRSLSNVYTGFDFLTSLGLGSTFYNMLPYLISLIVLAFASKRSRAPKAEGIPYEKGQR